MKTKINFYAQLEEYIGEVLSSFDSIPAQRQKDLLELADFIRTKIHSGETVSLNFICTHNSRRSHLSQIWAGTAAAFFGLEGIKTYSGGTEATAFNPRAVAAIERAGFKVTNPGGDNPHYLVSYAEGASTMECFSKTFDDTFNPGIDIIAVMTCSDADQNCPFIPGAILRSPIRYKDPKEADNSPEEAQRYDERCRQIAVEMFYLMTLVKNG